MNPERFDAPSWLDALTLNERLASLRHDRLRERDGGIDEALSNRRLQKWRAQPPFTSGTYFSQRLAADGLSEEDFRYLLGETSDSLKGRCPEMQGWLSELSLAFRSPSTDPSFPPGTSDGAAKFSFHAAIDPLVSRGRDRLRLGIQEILRKHTEHPIDSNTIEDLLFASLPEQLEWKLSRTMVLELNIARLQGLLPGESAEERFKSFLRRVSQPDNALALLEEYPVLARQIVICMEHWISAGLNFLRDLCADWPSLKETFSFENGTDALTGLKGGIGDGHRGGRSVLIASFASGFRIVYKPRSLAIDQHFQEFLDWVNVLGNHPRFRTLKIIDRGDHGWIEYVKPCSCGSEEEVRRFYERQGGYLAMLYLLNATDFHHENLIAAGEHPVLIDMEALFHPLIARRDSQHAEELAAEALHLSVIRVGLLPQRLWSNRESEGVDISGLGSTAGELTPFLMPTIEEVGKDEMHFVRKRLPMQASQNLPSLDGKAASALEYVEAIAQGFTGIYRLLLEHRGDLLSEHGPMARFSGDEVRVILRPTQTYAVLLNESYHPDLLRNQLDRDQLLDRLWSTVERDPYLPAVIPAEREDLLGGDIPMFTTTPNSQHLWTSSGVKIEAFLEETGLSLSLDCARRLSDEDLRKQLWFIRASLATLSSETQRSQRSSHGSIDSKLNAADRERFLAGALAVGGRLESLALRSDREASWIGLTAGARRWSLKPLGHDLYEGLSGVALFLAYLGEATRDDRHAELARAALAILRKKVDQGNAAIASIGAFDGWGGVVYVLTHLAALWKREDLLSEAEACIEHILPLIEKDDRFDIISGAAGCMSSLIGLHRLTSSIRALEAALRCGDRLLACARPMKQGLGWIRRGFEEPLSGFSHGAAGIGWALIELARASGENRFRGAGKAALAYEKTLFDREARNWYDLRPLQGTGEATRTLDTGSGGGKRFSVTWCHGAPGIGLSRLRLLGDEDDPSIRSEIDAAIETTLSRGFGTNHSLCHGDLGNLEFLTQASRVLRDRKLATKADRIAAAILESFRCHGPICGLPLDVESPGLMTGLAGIGYGFLRLADPERVPSVLMLAPPPEGIRRGPAPLEPR